MLEIERKYLVCRDDYLREASHHHHIRQGYLTADWRTTVRVRIIDEEARLTIKGGSTPDGLIRSEWEYAIPLDDAEEMLRQCANCSLEKVRYYVPYEGFVWEVDRFGGRLEGLVMAEVELTSPADQPALPSWLGREVTGDPHYYNAMLAQELTPPPTT
ncbi:MAG: CYTH domain-containing protein [Porphyromonas sp.]|uniref:CYTH domain-containing protein n=1 Tax=Porphyromonas sp. TaxID=1924944 RepID=UPI002A754B83|nr:CYTH domain-containing protein [Porphyromonas sp.]MDY3112409.1 CYTH domain-containing protein [Porphyromonas sp.]MDY4246093.1 CYTH domain-containing protein [Porphyromonas sp.]